MDVEGVIAIKRRVHVLAGVSVAAVLAALLLAGCNVLADDLLGSGPHMKSPEADAIFYLAVRDEVLDAEVLWTGVHDDIKAETSRSEFVDCVYARADQTGPAAVASAQGDEFELSIANLATYRGEVRSTNVLVRGEKTYSVADRRHDRGIIFIDVQVKGPNDTSVTTVMLAPGVDDQHWNDPRYSPDGYGGGQGFAVVGTVPEDPCLARGQAVRQRLQTTGMISFARHRGHLPELMDYRVLAVVWDDAPDGLNTIGGAFWWADDEGNGEDGVHPPNETDVDTAGAIPSDDAEPRRTPDWVVRAFLPAESVRIEPGTYTIEVWANPNELTPSTNPRVPADAAERNCSIEVDVTAGTHLDIILNDIPTDDNECPHESELRFEHLFGRS